MSALRSRSAVWSSLPLLAILWVGQAGDVLAQGSPPPNAAAPPLPDGSRTTSADDLQNQEPPAHLAIADGAVTLERENVAEPATSGEALIPGDRLRSDGGRAEIYFADGSVLDVDEFTTIELQGPGLLRLTSGRILLSLVRPLAGTPSANAAAYQIDTPAASTTVEAPGEYRIGMLGTSSTPQVEVAVVRGRAELVTERGSLALNAGERSVAWADGAASYPERFNSARVDAFEQWASAQRDQRTGTRSAQYLPPDLRTYSGAFDRYGSWQNDPSYGPVWYPTVTPGWQPYYNGYWSPLPRYGWTWIGAGIWSWPTHHYGRWGFASSRWFWIPDRRWGPGWVAWGSAPGYVSWTPLGFGNRLALAVGIGRSWGGWTVVPRNRFGVRGGFVNQYALSDRVLVARGPVVRPGVAPPLPANVVSAGRVVARGRPTFGGPNPSVIDMTRRGTVMPRTSSASPRGPGVMPRSPNGVLPRSPNGVMPRYPNGSASRDQSGAPGGSIGGPGGATRGPSAMPRTSPGVARSPGAVQRAPYAGAPPAGANWNGAPGNPSASRVVPRGGGSFSVGPGGVNRGPADGSRERPDFPGTRGGGAPMVMPRNGAPMTAPGYSPNVMRRPQPGAAMAPRGFDGAPRGFDGTPRGFDSAPRGFGGDRSRTYAPGGVGGARPGAPLSPQSVMPRGGVGGSWSGGAGMRGSESRTFGPQGGGSFRAPGQSFSGGGGGGSFAVPRGPQSMSPGFGGGGGGGVAPRSGGSMRAPAQPGPPAGGGGGGGGARSPGSRRPG